jgi:hypothetical protein
MGVLIGGKPAARMGDMCAHGGTIVAGCPTVLIGEVGVAGGAPAPPSKPAMQQIFAQMAGLPAELQKGVAQVMALKQAAESGAPFCEICK